MKLGQQIMELLKAQITGCLKPGDDLVVAGEVGSSGAVRMIEHEEMKLHTYFSAAFLRMSKEKLQKAILSTAAEQWKSPDITAVYCAGEGGILCGLWKIAEASGIGLEVDLRKIPICQETIEISERLDVDPYKLLTDGSVLLGTVNGDALVRRLEMQGIHASVIGHVQKGNARLLRSGEVVRYLDRPSQDELGKFEWGAEWKNESKIPGIAPEFFQKGKQHG